MKTTLSTLLVLISTAVCSVFAGDGNFDGPCPKVKRVDYKDWKSMDGIWWIPFRTPDEEGGPFKCMQSKFEYEEGGLNMIVTDRKVVSESNEIEFVHGHIEIGPDGVERKEAPIDVLIIDVDKDYMMVFACIPKDDGKRHRPIGHIFIRDIPKDKSKLDEVEKRGKEALKKNGVDENIMGPIQLDDECPQYH